MYYDLVTYPVKNLNGEVTKIIEIWRDITKQISSHWAKKTEELKADLNTLIQEDRMISLGKLVASCVHEINNPIQGLLTFSHLMGDTLAEGNLSEDDLKNFRKYTSLMSQELERCGNIVSGLLSFSRESPMEYKTIDINDILEVVITLTQHKMELQEIKLIKNLFPKNLFMEGDVHHLQQCFLNLIFNAVEAMPRGGQLTVASCLDREKNSIQIEIQDTGYGISPQNQDHIFDPFFTTKEEGEGTGLGLSIAYGVVKNHMGDINVKSKVGKGTIFKVSFPAPQSNCIDKRGGHG
jgi:signal transduction histidine kinase